MYHITYCISIISYYILHIYHIIFIILHIAQCQYPYLLSEFIGGVSFKSGAGGWGEVSLPGPDMKIFEDLAHAGLLLRFEIDIYIYIYVCIYIYIYIIIYHISHIIHISKF